jgi:hypothetical protein
MHRQEPTESEIIGNCKYLSILYSSLGLSTTLMTGVVGLIIFETLPFSTVDPPLTAFTSNLGARPAEEMLMVLSTGCVASTVGTTGDLNAMISCLLSGSFSGTFFELAKGLDSPLKILLMVEVLPIGTPTVAAEEVTVAAFVVAAIGWLVVLRRSDFPEEFAGRGGFTGCGLVHFRLLFCCSDEVIPNLGTVEDDAWVVYQVIHMHKFCKYRLNSRILK